MQLKFVDKFDYTEIKNFFMAKNPQNKTQNPQQHYKQSQSQKTTNSE